MKRPKAHFFPLFITKLRDALDTFVSDNKKRKKLSVFQLNSAMHGGKLIVIITVKTGNRTLSSLPELFGVVLICGVSYKFTMENVALSVKMKRVS